MANNLIEKKGKLNQEEYNKKVQQQQQAFAQIDSAMAVLEKLPYMADSNSLSFEVSLSISLS